MIKFEKDILNLIQSSIKGTEPTCKELDFKQIFEFAKKQQIVGLLFYSLSKIEDFKNSEIYSDFFKAYLSNLQYSEIQKYELKNLFDNFDEKGIDYVPLKGCFLKNIYPEPDMRTMSDADILIKLDQVKSISLINKNCGFEYKYESDHEIVWEKDNCFTIELHKRLIPSYNKDYYNYYGDGWKIIKDNKMSLEDNFIYLFTHFSKHYRDGGVGIKYVIDFYVFSLKYKLDNDYLQKELKKLQLYEFYVNIMKTIDVWFNNGEETEKTEFITNFLFSCFVYGDQKLHAKSEGLKISKSSQNIKAKKALRLFFPPYKSMVALYRFLKYVPVLLPVMYIFRGIEIVLTRPNKIKKNLKNLEYYSNENVSEYQKQLNYVGLDFNFKKKNEKKDK